MGGFILRGRHVRLRVGAFRGGGSCRLFLGTFRLWGAWLTCGLLVRVLT